MGRKYCIREEDDRCRMESDVFDNMMLNSYSNRVENVLKRIEYGRK